MKVYKFIRYEKIFPRLYNCEKQRIGKVLSKSCLIEHIGSTAVPGLPGKGIIDIMISCPKNNIKKVRDDLKKEGYVEGKSSDKGRIFLKREAKIKGKIRRFHVHIITKNNLIWNNSIRFRNYLIKNSNVSKKYAELKKKATISCNNDGKVYRKLKDKFIKTHLKKAIKRHI